MANWKQALAGTAGGALSGGATGAAWGSAGGPIGTAGGASIGAILGLLAGLFGGGNEGGYQKSQNFNPQRASALQQLLSSGMQGLQNPYRGFEPIEQGAKNFFQQQLVPGLQEQFAGSGNNAYSSPVLQTNLSSAGAGLAERLAMFKAQYGQQNQQNALNQIQTGLTPENEYSYQQSQPGLGEGILTGSLNAAPYALQGYLAHQGNNALIEALKGLKPK